MTQHIKYILSALIIVSCSGLKDTDSELPKVITLEASSVTRSTAILNGETSGGESNMITRGVCFSTSEHVSFTDKNISVTKGSGRFSVMTHELKPLTTYYIRAFSVLKDGKIIYGDILNFTTKDFELASLKMSEATDVLSKEATVQATIVHEGDYPVNSYGFVYSTKSDVTLDSDEAYSQRATKEGELISATLTGLEIGTRYYVKAYAQTSYGTAYSDEYSFKTSDKIPAELEDISIIENTVLNIKIRSAIADPHGTVNEFGFCWSTENPAPNRDDQTINLTGQAFEHTISGFAPNTRLYIRAYAVNEAGINYSKVLDTRIKTYDCHGMMVTVVPPEMFYLGWLGDPADTQNQGVYSSANDGLLKDFLAQNTTYGSYSTVKGLAPFRIAATEVTYEDYVDFLNIYGSTKVKDGEYAGKDLFFTECLQMIYDEDTGLWSIPAELAKHPAVGITWYGANEFCTFYGGFLPNEPQWENAARGNIYSNDPAVPMYRYSGSNDINEVAVYNQSTTNEVMSRKPNQLGIYDMSGNAEEWTRSPWVRSYPKNWTDSKPTENMVARGCRSQRGVLVLFQPCSRAAYQTDVYSVNKHNYIGFRFCDANVE